jgi:hypothetical protein
VFGAWYSVVQRNKENALKKKYHHTLEQGGYKIAIPKIERDAARFAC